MKAPPEEVRKETRTPVECAMPEGIKERQTAARHYAQKAEEIERSSETSFYVPSDEEVGLLNRSVDCDPLFRGHPWARLARRALSNHRELEAEYYLGRAKDLSPRSAELRLLQAELAAMRGDDKLAFELCSDLMGESKDSKDNSPWFVREILSCVGERALETKNVTIARDALTRLQTELEAEEKPHPVLSKVFFDLGRAWEMGTDRTRFGPGSDLDKALALFERAYNGDPPQVWAAFHLALVYAEKKQFEDADTWNEKFINDVPGVAVAIYNRACYKARTGDLNGAFKALQKAFDMGFRDRKHVENDADLETLRTDERYQKLLQTLPQLAVAPP